MPWFKVDDTLAHHAKVIAAGNGAMGLWVRAGAWSMQQLTDGFVPGHVVRTLGTPKEAKSLVSAGLWLAVEGGYQFHEWTDVQRTKEQVKADRDAATERQRRAREAAKSRSESRRDKGVSHSPPDQTRPDQTSSSFGTTEDDKSSSAPKRAHQLPDSWVPNDKHAEIAAQAGVSLEAEVVKMRDWAKGGGVTKKDWDATCRNWLRNARPDPRLSQPAPYRPRPHETVKPPDGLTDQQLDEFYADPHGFLARWSA